jgi:murein DD-endopeptidase MepM/ murein hydrolase activator NlpD
MEEVVQFIDFLRRYSASRATAMLQVLDEIKGLVVRLLLLQRGKYATSFLNTSFLVLLVLVFVSAPTIAQNNPFQSGIDDFGAEDYTYNLGERIINLDEAGVSMETIRNRDIRDKVEIYIVNEGDTLTSVAKKFEVTENTLIWANNLRTRRLRVGMSLKIPPVSGVVHTVVTGDNIYALAKKYQVSPQTIVNFPFNEFRDNSFTLIVGSTLIIPEGSIADPQEKVRRGYSFAPVVAGVRGSSTFIWPTNGMITQYPASYHMALDIANSAAPPVLAADSGTVIFSGCFGWGYGCHVIIDHGNGFKTLYAHLSRLDTTQGQSVSQGQQIGQMGSTGRSTGTHLHFEIRENDLLKNPLSFLQ